MDGILSEDNFGELYSVHNKKKSKLNESSRNILNNAIKEGGEQNLKLSKQETKARRYWVGARPSL